MARRNYEALNEQLIEELPHFIQLARGMINHMLIVLIQLQFKFHTAIHTLLEQLVDICGMRSDEHRMPLQSDEVQGRLSTALAEVAARLVKLSIVPTSLAMNYSLPGAVRGSSRRGSENVSLDGEREEDVSMSDSLLSTSSEVDMDSSLTEVGRSTIYMMHTWTSPLLIRSPLTSLTPQCKVRSWWWCMTLRPRTSLN